MQMSTAMSHPSTSTLQSDVRAPSAFAGLEKKKFAYCLVGSFHTSGRKF